MTDERRAVVWCWLAIFYELESDDIHYAWPPPTKPEDFERAEELHKASEACYRKAVALDSSSDLWVRAQASWADAPDVAS